MSKRANPRTGHDTAEERPTPRSNNVPQRSRRARRLLLAALLGGTFAVDLARTSADEKPTPAIGPAPAQVQAAENSSASEESSSTQSAGSSKPADAQPGDSKPGNSKPGNSTSIEAESPRRTLRKDSDTTTRSDAKPSADAKSPESKKESTRRLRLDAFRPRDPREPAPPTPAPKSFGPALKARVIETTPLNEQWRIKHGAPPSSRSSSPDDSPSVGPTPAVEPTRDPPTSRRNGPTGAEPTPAPASTGSPQVDVDLPLAPPLDPPLAKRPLTGATSPRPTRLDPSQAGVPRPNVGVELIDPAAAPPPTDAPESAAPTTTPLTPVAPARTFAPTPSSSPTPSAAPSPAAPRTEPARTEPARTEPADRGPAPQEPEVNQPSNHSGANSRTRPANEPLVPLRIVGPQSDTAAPQADVVRESAVAPNSGVVREDVFPSRYQNLTPGESTIDDVRRRLGEPLAERPDGGDVILSYRSGPFRQVDVHIRKKVVDRIRVELMRPTAPDSVARELQLEDFLEAWQENAQGDLVGVVIPERGVIFELKPGTEETLVTHVVLGRITAEGFRLRAEWQPDHPVERMLEDLAYARQLDPADARSAVREAELRGGLGEYSTALARLDEAVKLNPRDPALRVARAEVLARVERHAEAYQVLQDLLKDSSVPELYQLMAEHQLGNLAARGPTRAFDSALDHHRRATELAAPLVNDKRAAVRRAAKRVLLEAHLGAANDIARGDFSDKPRMILKWLVTGQSVLTAVKDEYPDDSRPEWRWSASVLRIYAAESGMPKPLERVAEIRRYAQALQVEARDPAYQRQLRWESAEMLFDAMQVANAHEQHDLALECIREAVQNAEAGAVGRDSTLERDYFLGRLYFHLGSLYALHHKNHSAAVEQYRKAATYFVRPLPDSAKIDMGRQGERLVSMGLSYWQIDDREQALRWTRQGALLMQDAVRNETLDPRSLHVPYNNLARMYHELGRTDEARVYTARASELSRPDAVIRR